MKNKILIFIFLFLVSFIKEAFGDTIYLRNGRSIEGLIKKEDEESVELDVGFGTVKFRKETIENIYRSSVDEIGTIRQEWQSRKEEESKRSLKREREKEEAMLKKEFEPKEVGFSKVEGHIVVNALLNKKIKASLLLDTGASLVLLSSRIAKELRIEKSIVKKETIEVLMADGRKVEAIYVVLDTVEVEGLEARDVGAVVLADDTKMDFQDGLLGMSFLNKFNFQIDTVNKKLILERQE